MSTDFLEAGIAEIRQLCLNACLACGASEAFAESLVEATLSATCHGRPEVGFPHLTDYLDGLIEGRIDGQAEPRIGNPLPALFCADAGGSIAQLGFDRVFDRLVETAKHLGVAIFTQKNSYTTGELGYYVRRLAACGLVSLAASNTHAMVAPGEGGRAAFGTNPLAFGAPLPPSLPPLIIDQAASATAFVNLLRAAAEGMTLPEGWAVDAEGASTTDPSSAIEGALLPFGGYKGANIALMVEILAAGLSGAAWSLDAGNFRSGKRRTNVGFTVIAVHAGACDPDFAERLAGQLHRLASLGVHIPGRSARDAERGRIRIGKEVLDRIRDLAAR